MKGKTALNSREKVLHNIIASSLYC